MMNRHRHGSIVWIDLESPTHEEVRGLINEFSLDAFVAEELLFPSVKPRCEAHKDYLYVILHFPAIRHSHKVREQEVDFIVGRDFIITARYDTVDPLHKFSKVFEVNSVLDKSNIGEHAGFVFYYMLRKMYKSIEHELSYVHDALLSVERQLFKDMEREMVASLSHAGRDLLVLRQAIEPHRDVLHTLEFEAGRFFGDEFRPYLRGLTNSYFRVHNHLMRQTEALKELRETNNSLLSTKQGEIMKNLTIVSFITFPLALVAAVFGMNIPSTPIVSRPDGFWVIMAIMGCAAFMLFGYFKHKKWL